MDERSGTVIITGASGRLGVAVALRLAGRYRVVAFDRAGPPLPPPEIESIDMDTTSDGCVRTGLNEFRDRCGSDVVAVVHLAAYYDFSGGPSPLYEEINVAGSGRLIRGLGVAGLRVEQFIYASTMVVHSPGEPGRPIDEAAPLGPTLPYSRSKLRAEEVLRAGRGDTPLVILRLANVYDDLVHHPVLAQQFCRDFERRAGCRLFPGDPSRGQSYLHKEDLLDAVERIIDRRTSLPLETTLLLGEPGAVGYESIQRELGRLLHGREWSTHRVPKALARAGARILRVWPWSADDFIRPWMIDRADDHYELDVTLARGWLDWTPGRSLMKSLPVMAQALIRDPRAWYRENGLRFADSCHPPKAAAAVKATPR